MEINICERRKQMNRKEPDKDRHNAGKSDSRLGHILNYTVFALLMLGVILGALNFVLAIIEDLKVVQ